MTARPHHFPVNGDPVPVGARRPGGRRAGGEHGCRAVRLHPNPAADDRAGGAHRGGRREPGYGQHVGYLIGALAGTLAPGLVRSRAVHHGSLALLVATLAGMPLTHSTAAWLVLRLLAGVASAVTFVIALSALLGHLPDHPAHLPGWGLGGIGAGIALSGALVLVVHSVAGWQAAWWAATLLAAFLAASAWTLRLEPPAPPAARTDAPHPRTHRWFSALLASYTLEGIGYIMPGLSSSPRSTRARPAGSTAARGCSSVWPLHRPRPCGRRWVAASPARTSWPLCWPSPSCSPPRPRPVSSGSASRTTCRHSRPGQGNGGDAAPADEIAAQTPRVVSWCQSATTIHGP
jgi:hypothetical protein